MNTNINLSHKAMRVVAEALAQYIENADDSEMPSIAEVEKIQLAQEISDFFEAKLEENLR